ncbi:MAG: hypothetical protein ACLFVU_00215 [Phycisphaerae bacterium]
MPADHREMAFEAAIEHHLTTAGGYVSGDCDGFDPHRTVFLAEMLTFVNRLLHNSQVYCLKQLIRMG